MKRIVVVVLLSFFISFPLFSQASFLNQNPLVVLREGANILAQRVSDLVLYLIKQKQYIFNNYSDPNKYEGWVNEPYSLSTSTVRLTDQSNSNRPIRVSTSTVPAVKITEPAPARSGRGQVATPTIGLVVKSDEYPKTQTVVQNNNSKTDNSSILYYTNQERLAQSLKPLISSRTLDIIASQRADDLFTNQYFEHSSPDGQSAPELAKKIGYDYILIGENLALGSFDGDRGIVEAWMNSPGHRANILNKDYSELGVSEKVGIFDGQSVTIAVQIFGDPINICPKPNPETKILIDNSSVAIKQDQEKAKAMYDNLMTIRNSPNLDSSYYNQKVQEYNYFAKTINDSVLILKNTIDAYNLEVSRYNNCLNS